MAFRGSKPKWLCSERARPRTATIEEVTSTAQIAICTASNRSRTVTRRPLLIDPDLTISYGSVRSTCLTGTAPERNPLAKANCDLRRAGHFFDGCRAWPGALA